MLKQIKPQEGWTTLLLLWGMLVASAMALHRADLIDGLHIIPLISTCALLAGLLLAKSRFTANTAHLMSIVYGLFIIFYLIGQLQPETMAWRDRVIDLVDRQLVWLVQLFDGSTSRDRLIFVIQTSAIYWVLGYTAAWYTFRVPHVWRVVVPTGLVLLSVVYYYTGPQPLSIYLVAYLVLALLYIARTHLVSQELEWQRAAVIYERTIWASFLRASLIVGLLGLIIAWSMPTMAANVTVSEALEGTRGPWREFQDTWTRLFSALRSYSSETRDPYLDTLVLGGPRSVGNSLVMDVYVNQPLPYAYWQAVAYDRYNNGLWSVSESVTKLRFPDDGDILVPPTQARQVIRQTVTNYLTNSSTLYGLPEIVTTNKQMFVDETVDERGRSWVTAVRSRYVLRSGDQYQVTSHLSAATATELRRAGVLYPESISGRYLQMSPTITPETIALAEEITAPYNNPFDKAIAVRDYLRQNIVYNDQIDAAPHDVDPVHFVLFEQQEGYCTYYASAMVMMLRSQGVPARFVSGYAQGEFDPASNSYRVRADNAHTWVEVYFPTYGWIQFEPTASIPIVERPEGGAGGDAFDQADADENERDLEGLLAEEQPEELDPDMLRDLRVDDGLLNGTGDASETAVNPFAAIPIWQIILALSTISLTGLLLHIANEMNKKVEGDVLRSYGRLGSWGGWLGIFFRPTQTPHERADLLATAVPEGETAIHHLTDQFVLTQFSPHKQSDADFDPREEWQVLRPLFIRKALQTRWEKIQASTTQRRKSQ